MKLNDVYTKPLKDDDGEVRSIELKYEPNNRFTKGTQS